MREKGAYLNTHIKKVKGFTSDGVRSHIAEINIRCTSDGPGESISLEDGRTLIQVYVDDVEELIAEARADRKE